MEILLAPDGVTLSRNFSMARGQWMRTRLIVGTCFGVDHNASEGLREFGEELSERDTELEEYLPRDASLLPQIPTLILRHAQIRWSNWLASQWGKTSEVPFPDLAGLWTAMENQEPWEPTFPAGYNLAPDAAYRGNMSPRPIQGMHTSARWAPAETPTAPPRTVPTPKAPSKAEPASRRGGRGVSANPSSGGVWAGGGSTGEDERPNAIAYNNADVEERCGLFRNAGAMRLITRKASAAGVELPSLPVDPKYKACPTYHIKEMCNTGCSNVGDHITHTWDQDPPLWGWAVKDMPEITAPSAPVA